MKTDELRHVHTQLIWWSPFNLNQLTDEYWPAVVSVITALHPTYLLSVDILIFFFEGGGSFTLFFLMSWFLSWIFFSFCLLFFSCRCYRVRRLPPHPHPPPPSSISVQAAKLQWSLDEKLGSSRGTRVSRPFLCVCVCFCWCVVLLSGLTLCDPKLPCDHILAYHLISDVSLFTTNHCAAWVVPLTWPPLTLGGNLSVVLWETSLKLRSVNIADS